MFVTFWDKWVIGIRAANQDLLVRHNRSNLYIFCVVDEDLATEGG